MAELYFTANRGHLELSSVSDSLHQHKDLKSDWTGMKGFFPGLPTWNLWDACLTKPHRGQTGWEWATPSPPEQHRPEKEASFQSQRSLTVGGKKRLLIRESH